MRCVWRIAIESLRIRVLDGRCKLVTLSVPRSPTIVRIVRRNVGLSCSGSVRKFCTADWLLLWVELGWNPRKQSRGGVVAYVTVGDGRLRRYRSSTTIGGLRLKFHLQ